ASRDKPGNWYADLTEFSNGIWPEFEATIARMTAPPNAPSVETLGEIHVWFKRVSHHLARMRWDFETFFPWLALTQTPPRGHEDLAHRIESLLAPSMSLGEAKELCAQAASLLTNPVSTPSDDDVAGQWLSELAAAIERGAQSQIELRQRLFDNAVRADAMASAMDFKLLYDQETRLFNIGYNASSDRIDPHRYDLLATEARLASYFAIAKRDVPTEHWFFLGRPIVRSAGELSLLSWNGSLFEYLMPSLLLRSGADKLLGQSERAAVKIQRRYSDGLGVPWGISESAFASMDSDQHYHYRAFGVPGARYPSRTCTRSRDRTLCNGTGTCGLSCRGRLKLAEDERVGAVWPVRFH